MTWRPTPPTPFEREPEAVAASLDRAARSLGLPGAGVLAAVFSRWEAAVGADIAGHARPLSLRDGVLVVGVDQPGWATQLRYLSTELLERLAEVTPQGSVTELRIAVEGAPRTTRRTRSRPG